jgi:hypothetical protein
MLFSGRKQAEPKYEIPQEVFRATQMAQEMAQTGMPEASRMMALQGAQQSALFGMRAAQDRRGGLMSIGNIQAGLDRSNLSIAAQDASMRQQNQRFAQQALMTQAQYKDKAFANQYLYEGMRKQESRERLNFSEVRAKELEADRRSQELSVLTTEIKAQGAGQGTLWWINNMSGGDPKELGEKRRTAISYLTDLAKAGQFDGAKLQELEDSIF